MKIFHLFRTSLIALGLNKARSALTILGIVIGITAIILIVSLGQGAQNLVLGEIEGLGSELIVIRPGQEPSGPTDIGGTLFADSLKERDVEALKKKANVPYAADVAPVIIVPGSVSYLGETYRPQIFGWSAEFMSRVFNIYPEEGVMFGESETRQRSSVAVIGSKVRDELFGLEDPLGKNIKIRGRSFRVVGVLSSQGQVAFFNVDEIVLIPPSTAQTYLLGIDYYNEVLVLAESPELVERTVRDIELTLRESHKITDPKKDDFFVVTQEGLVNQIGTILGVLTAFLSSVVAISLVVGGIGVMNIMLVSVTERTREIGLRKAIGATNRDILGQFLIEAVFLTGAGGAIGVFFGIVLSFVASLALSRGLGVAWAFSFPWSAAIIGVAVSGLVGLVFGIYPARQASRKNPIEALRYE
ncbi:MAG: ABC transporter permease [bacterium]|nr:ABC transporter permease [bacterium]MDZ4232123.1 ABC transporter permease [Candidatus Pacearchaeota archaeon]